MRPADPEQHASGTAGLVESSRPAPVPRSFPWLRALVVIIIAATSLASPMLGSFTQCFAVSIMALGIARGGRRGFAVVCVVGSALVAGVLTASTDVQGMWVAAAVLGAGLTGVLGIEQARAAQPDPDPASEAPSWPEPRADRGVSYATYTWLVAAVVLVVFCGTAIGTSRISHAMQVTVRTSFEDYQRACSKGGILEKDETTCERFDSLRADLLDAARDHAPTILTIFAALSLAGGAWTAHGIVITRNRALAQQGWSIATRPSYKLRFLEFHWSWAYVGIVGVLAMLLAREWTGMSGGAQEWTFAAGAGLAATAAQVLGAHGAGFTGWLLSRRPLPLWYRIFLVFMVLFAWPFVLGVLLIAGALDMQFGLRRRLIAAAADR